MPLDAAGYVIDAGKDHVAVSPVDRAVDPLAKLGITPVPADFVKHYKREYKRKWLSENTVSFPGDCKWRTIECGFPQRAMVKVWLTRGLGGMISSDVSPAPRELVDLADLVARKVPRARFSVDYFYRDPVLNVLYPVGDAWRTACLGIWDAGKMVQISDYPPRKFSRFLSGDMVGRALILVGYSLFVLGLVSIFI